MTRFEEGREYQVNGGGRIRITRRTPCYVTYVVVGISDIAGREILSGRRMVGLFGDCEAIWVDTITRPLQMLCMAKH